MKSTNILSPLFSADQIRWFELKYMLDNSVDNFSLMKTAGTNAWNRAKEIIEDGTLIHIFCGPGNNGGDGWIFAQQAYINNFLVYVWYIEPKAETAIQSKKWALQTIPTENCFNLDQISLNKFASLVSKVSNHCNDCYIDALLGIGLNRPVSDKIHFYIQQINNSKGLKIALDIPTGINSDSAESMGVAFKADFTITFIAMKLGLIRDAGKVHAGKIFIENLGVNASFELLDHNNISIPFEFYLDKICACQFPHRDNHSHKGSYGTLLCVGGDEGMAGACIIAAESASNFGAGKVFLASHKEHASMAVIRCPGLMTISLDNSIRSNSRFQNILTQANTLVVGPGLGQSSWSLDCFKACFEGNFHGTIILDADALNLISDNDEAYELVTNSTLIKIMTPHPKEAAQLHSRISSKINPKTLSPFELAIQLSQHYKCICLLKGYGTIVAIEKQGYICTSGNAALAKAGQGDCLSGMIGALVAQNLPALDAVRYAAWSHGIAGELWSKEQSELSLLPHETAKIAARAIEHYRHSSPATKVKVTS